MSEPPRIFKSLYDQACSAISRCCDSRLHPPLSEQRIEELRQLARVVPDMILASRSHPDFATIIYPLIERFREHFDGFLNFSSEAPQVVARRVNIGAGETDWFDFGCEPLDRTITASQAFAPWLTIEARDFAEELQRRCKLATYDPLVEIEKRVKNWLEQQTDSRHKQERVIKMGSKVLLDAVQRPGTAIAVSDCYDSVAKIIAKLQKAIPEAAGWFVPRRTRDDQSVTYIRGRKPVRVLPSSSESPGKCTEAS